MQSIGFLTLDLIIIIVALFIIFFWAIKKGRRVLAKIILFFYPTTLLFFFLPYYEPTTVTTKSLVFLIIFIIFYTFLKDLIHLERSYGNRKYIDSILLSIGILVIFLTIYYRILGLETLFSLNLPISLNLIKNAPIGLLYSIPILSLILINKK